jgi:hypothetical protein
MKYAPLYRPAISENIESSEFRGGEDSRFVSSRELFNFFLSNNFDILGISRIM